MDSQDSAVGSPLARMRERFDAFWIRWGLALIGFAFFLAVVLAGSAVLSLEANRLDARRKVELVSFGSLLQARLHRELSGALFLASGLSSYLAVRAGKLDRREVEAILARLYADARHVRYFGIVVGYRQTYVYPVKGNERAIGLYYPDVPAQWPYIRRASESGKAVLVGPLNVVQGGRVLIYRVPVSIRGRYWGMFSTVIDANHLFAETLGEVSSENVAFAVRGKDGLGRKGEVFWGDPRVFEQSDVEQIDVEVPGGKWIIALQAKFPPGEESGLLRLRILVWVLAAFLGWGTYALLVQRARLARLALFDQLTGLPNRSLIEDRLSRAISVQRRNPSTLSALLFVDLDGFKSINDRYGHRAGDAVLHGVATRAQHAVRDIDSVGRWGGDELIVVLENADRRTVPELIERVRQAVETPIEFAGQSLKVGASIGSAIVPDDGESAGDLIRLADRRMYEDKQNRKRFAGQEG
jgi:diguanylate cyclase (GGDEF)-like protein